MPEFRGIGPTVQGDISPLFEDGLAYTIVEDIGAGRQRTHFYNGTGLAIRGSEIEAGRR